MKKSTTITVAIAGNPNSGKTSLFNEIVGSNQKVGNWSGVTFEKYVGVVNFKGYKIEFIDLPGTYSLTAYSPEEVIARNFIIEEKPDVVVNVVDSTNLERNLYLTTQLMELDANLIIALNIFDEVQSQGIKIDDKLLQTLFGSHVIPTSATKKIGIESLLNHVIRVYEGQITIEKNKLSFSPVVEEKIEIVEKLLEQVHDLSKRYSLRWLAIKLLENDKEVYAVVKEFPIWIKVEKVLIDAYKEMEKLGDDDLELVINNDRNSFIRGALMETVVFPEVSKISITEWIDSILINRILGLPIFLFIMWAVFQFTFTFGKAPMGWIEAMFKYIANIASFILPNGIIESIIIDGVLAGVGGVLVFLPNILLLFIALSFLEGTGYMARAAFVVDKVMHKVGLHGKSFLPMITGFGCSVPAIMGTRTLKNRGDRLVTMMIIPFMSCGAKLPVYVLLTGAFFPTEMAGNVLFGIYLFGIMVAVVSAKFLKSSLFKGDSEPFVMELPTYRLPTLRSILVQAKFKAEMYLRRAGTIILVASLIIWLAGNYPHSVKLDQKFETQSQSIRISQEYSLEEQSRLISELEHTIAASQLEYSFSGRAGKLIEPIIKPLGFDWRTGIAIISGLAAKEVVVSTLGTIYSLGDVNEEAVDLGQKLRNDPNFNTATALSLMIFVLLYLPCIATIAIFRKEAGSWKWVGIYAAYSLTIAWLSSFFVYQVGKMLF